MHITHALANRRGLRALLAATTTPAARATRHQTSPEGRPPPALGLEADPRCAHVAVACVATTTTAARSLYAATSGNRLLIRESVLAPADWWDIGHANRVTAMTGAGGFLWATTSDNRLWYRSGAKFEVDWKDAGHANGVVAMAAADGRLFAALTTTRSGSSAVPV